MQAGPSATRRLGQREVPVGTQSSKGSPSPRPAGEAKAAGRWKCHVAPARLWGLGWGGRRTVCVLMVQNPTRLSWPPSPSAGSQPFAIASASSSPSHGGQSAASGVLGPGPHPSALHGLWASSLMMCSRQAALPGLKRAVLLCMPVPCQGRK